MSTRINSFFKNLEKVSQTVPTNKKRVKSKFNRSMMIRRARYLLLKNSNWKGRKLNRGLVLILILKNPLNKQNIKIKLMKKK